MDNQLVIDAKDLTKVYGRYKAVDSLNLQVREGEVFGFLGPNGAGKTTSILMFLGLTEPTSGTIRVCGFNPAREPLRVKERVGYLPENVGFYDDMTAVQNLRYVARLNRLPDDVSTLRIRELLEEVGLFGDEKKRVGVYSKGMRQRLGIAEALIKDPKVVFLDEPTIGLDPEGTNHMLDLIHNLSVKKGIAVFLSSHLLDQVQRICNRVGIMFQGKLLGAGTIEDLAREKLGIGTEQFTLEEVYMKYFNKGE